MGIWSRSIGIGNVVSKLVEFLNFGIRRISGKLDSYDFRAIGRVSRILLTKPAFLRQAQLAHHLSLALPGVKK
jgi:hypothetical protein